MDNANFNKMVWKRSEGSEERVLHTVEAASVKAQCGEQAWLASFWNSKEAGGWAVGKQAWVAGEGRKAKEVV